MKKSDVSSPNVTSAVKASLLQNEVISLLHFIKCRNSENTSAF